jgi:hypothetical protein
MLEEEKPLDVSRPVFMRRCSWRLRFAYGPVRREIVGEFWNSPVLREERILFLVGEVVRKSGVGLISSRSVAVGFAERNEVVVLSGVVVAVGSMASRQGRLDKGN